MKKIAITGTIGSGKTTVAYLLRRRRMPVFDADGYSRICFNRNHPAYQQMVDAFSGDILDETGEIVRSRLAEKAFSSEENRLKLNAIIHPHVKDGLLKFFENHSSDPLVFAEIPLLYEVGWESLFDVCCVVTCSDETAVKRLIENRGFTWEDAERRIAAQLDREEKCRRADYVLNNDGTIRDLDHSVALWIAGMKGNRHGTERKRSVQGNMH